MFKHMCKHTCSRNQQCSVFESCGCTKGKKEIRKTKSNQMAATFSVLYIIAISLFSVEADILQNCTLNTCDLKTCSNTSQVCTQKCYTSNCQMSCASPTGCNMFCFNGGCTKLSCDIPSISGSSPHCSQECKENCRDMTCKAPNCHPTCSKDNCKITCDDGDAVGLCQPLCKGRGCLIDVHSTTIEGRCDGGSCIVRLSNRTSGLMSCLGGNCTLTCATGTYCRFLGSCPNCTGPLYVDDPFASNSTNKTSYVPNSVPNIVGVLGGDVALLFVYGILVVLSLLFI